jgi:hypothetical protein
VIPPDIHTVKRERNPLGESTPFSMITAPLALWPIYVKLLHSLIERYIHHRSRLGMKHVCETHTLAEECGGAGKEVHAEIDDDVNPGAETEDTVTLKVCTHNQPYNLLISLNRRSKVMPSVFADTSSRRNHAYFETCSLSRSNARTRTQKLRERARSLLKASH